MREHPSNKFGEWLSLVEHLVRDQGVGGSNPLSPTIHRINDLYRFPACPKSYPRGSLSATTIQFGFKCLECPKKLQSFSPTALMSFSSHSQMVSTSQPAACSSFRWRASRSRLRLNLGDQ